MSDLPSSNNARRVEATSSPILIFIRDNKPVTERRETCPRCGSTWDTWMCYDTLEETGNFAIQCWCGLRFEQIRDRTEEEADNDDH